MEAVTKIVFLDENGEKFFGEGPCRLLCGVEKTGSLRSSALSMGMSYSKALKILNNAERALGFPLTVRAAGGRTRRRQSISRSSGRLAVTTGILYSKNEKLSTL